MDNKGFTLIELTIVVVIVGLLAAVAMPMYQSYVARSQIIVALAELQGGKPQYELIINSGSASGSSDFTVSNMFFTGAQSEICIYAVNPPNSANISDPALACELKNVSPVLVGKFVYLSRNANGSWVCKTSVDVDEKFKPTGCI